MTECPICKRPVDGLFCLRCDHRARNGPPGGFGALYRAAGVDPQTKKPPRERQPGEDDE